MLALIGLGVLGLLRTAELAHIILPGMSRSLVDCCPTSVTEDGVGFTVLVVGPAQLGAGVLALGLYRRSSGLRRAADFANVIHKGVLGDLHRFATVEAVLAVGLPSMLSTS